MPTITDVSLSIHAANPEDPRSRKISIKYSVEFDSVEILAAQVFELRTRIVPYDNSYAVNENSTTTQQVRRRFVRAENGSHSFTDSITKHRIELDEDPDLYPPPPTTRPDEWFAKVTATPAAFESSTNRSTYVTLRDGVLA